MEVGDEKLILTMFRKLISHINIEQMARLARKELADMRAMEEEDMRMTMHGSGKHFYGAGATPSMGLSQFRGGGTKKGQTRKTARKAYEDTDEMTEEEMEGGQIATAVGRLAARFLPRAATTSTAIVPRVTARAVPRSSAIIPLGQFGRPVARPSLSAAQYRRMFQQRPSASPFVSTSGSQIAKRLAARFGPTAARAAAIGTTLGAVGSYLGDQFGADDMGDAGYYDDFAGEDYGYAPTGETGEEAPSGIPLIPAEGEIPEGLTPEELAWYLQSGNLPIRYATAPAKRKRGKGKLTIHHEGAGLTAQQRKTIDRLMGKLPERKFQHLESALQEKARTEEEKRLMEIAQGISQKAKKQVDEMKRKEEAAAAKKQEEAMAKLTAEQRKTIDRLMGKLPERKSQHLESALQEKARKQQEERRKQMAEALSQKARKEAEKRRSGGAKRSNARAQIVRQVMQERGCSLPQASRIVKEEGLY